MSQGPDHLHTGLYRVVYVSLSTGNVVDLYKTISWEMGLPVERSRAALYRQIKSEVSRLCTDARIRPILVVDEAHHLRRDVLEDLWLLTNYPGQPLSELLEDFPTVSKEQAVAALEQAKQALLASARPLDECLPRRLKRELVGHEARTASEMGWASKRNGELLRLAEREFDVFPTVDRKLRYQKQA